MAQENVKKFMELLKRDEELQKKVKEATEAYTGDKTDEKAVFDAVLAPIAKEAGYEFSFEDAEELAKTSGDDELSDDEAAAVAGGGWRSNACFVVGFTVDTDSWEVVDEKMVGKCIYSGAAACKGVGVGFSF